MTKLMWFGSRSYPQWIPCPAADTDMNSVGWSTKAQYLNGRAFVRRSATSHREYQFSWNLTSKAALQPIYDYAAGVYGPAPYYFIDPASYDGNILPEWWAAPGMATIDAPILFGTTIPTVIANTNQTQGYPTIGAVYTTSVGPAKQTLYIPIVPGYVFWIGAHTTMTGTSKVTITPYTGTTAGTPVNLTSLSVSTTTRVNASVSSASGYTGVEITLTGTGTATLYGLIAQMLLVGVTPPTGGFIGGQGNSGCDFEETPTRHVYSQAVGLDLIGASALLTEIGGG